MQQHQENKIYATTIVAVKKGNQVVIGGDGQVSFGNSIMKSNAKKIRKIADGSIIAGFAGATADAFTLFERLESKLEQYPKQLMRACVELAKDWRCDKYLRRLEAMLIVVDIDKILVLTGSGDVLEPEHNIAAIGSGGNFALAAAKAMIDIQEIDAKTIVVKSLEIAADLCIYTNHNITTEVLQGV